MEYETMMKIIVSQAREIMELKRMLEYERELNKSLLSKKEG